MKTNRREFIVKGSLIAAGTILLPSFTMKKSKMKPGLQAYSVRKQLTENFEATMKYVSKVGYKYIEGYGLDTDGMFLKKIKASHYAHVIKDLGMELKATHCAYCSADKAAKMIDAAKATGMDYLIVPSIPSELRHTLDQWKKVADNFNKLGEICKNVGLKFAYHNHSFEFQKMDGVIPQELLIESTDADLVAFEADLFWVTKAGYDPVKLIKKYPGRIKLFHVKDASAEMEGTTVGSGIINFEELFKVGKNDALEYYFIEDERTDNPYKNIKADYDYISSQNYAN
jgi:sugar phosphate isomerase/epimerase